MTEMAGLTNIDNAMMRELTEKSAKDADAVKWLTFLTLIYLPASFVAVSRFTMSENIFENYIELTTEHRL